MTLIEFIGCTGAGKSTLTGRLLRQCRDRGLDAWMGYDFVLRQVRLEWVKGRAPRGLIVSLVALCACQATWRSNRQFFRFVFQAIWRLPAEVAWLEKLDICRNVLKNIGIYEIIRRRAGDRQVVLLDEGPLQTAHYLFVHVSVEPNMADLATFIGLAPLPDAVVYVTESEAVLAERTLARGHKRIPAGSQAHVRRFVRRAVEVFDSLAQRLALAGGLLVVENGRARVAGLAEPDDRPLALALQMALLLED